MKLATRLHLVPRLIMTEFHPYAPICRHDAQRDEFTNSLLNPFHNLMVCFSKVKTFLSKT